jgi:hypothetical protein
MLDFIYFYCYLSSRIGHDFVHEQRYLDKDWSFITLTSSIRLFPFLRFKAPEWFSICWQIASHSYMSLYMAFSRKYGTVWYYPASSKLWHLTALSFVNFRKIDWHALEFARVLSQLFGLLCAWRRVRILRQHTFWHARWDPSVESRCLKSMTSWMSPLMTYL